MFYAIYDGKFSLSLTNAAKIYINLEIPEVAEIIDKCIFLNFIMNDDDDDDCGNLRCVGLLCNS